MEDERISNEGLIKEKQSELQIINNEMSDIKEQMNMYELQISDYVQKIAQQKNEITTTNESLQQYKKVVDDLKVYSNIGFISTIIRRPKENNRMHSIT